MPASASDRPDTVGPVPVTLGRRIHTTVDCTLPDEAVDDRMSEWAALLEGVERRSAVDGGLRLEFDPTTTAESVDRLVAAESTCCRFFDFRIFRDPAGVALEVRAPADASAVLTALFGRPDSPRP